MYAVGIDIGTTYTAAAVWRAGRAEIASLGSHSAAIPSVVLLRSDGSFLTGESANRRGRSEPNRVAREFKRRMGDTTPILLGGTPYSAAALTARMLRSVLDAVASREGGPPASICITHPANWGPYKVDLLRQVVRLADVDQPVQFTTEPQAAATYYAHQQPLERGEVVAVYDLGGGTFDAAVLRLTSDGFDLIDPPEGIERLGGVDFDAAILAHVAASVGVTLEQLGKGDAALIAAAAQLRDECVQAKEALSADTDATIQVLLPTVNTEVRLTRAELEAMVRPSVHDSTEALRRAIRSAGYAPQSLSAVLLVGGSSRMPIVAQLVSSELGRPVAVDANPKHAVALGAAWQASRTLAGSGPAAATPEPAKPSVQGAAGKTPALVGTPATPIPQPAQPAVPKPEPTKPADPKPEPTKPASPTAESNQPASPKPEPAQPTFPKPEPVRPADPRPEPGQPATPSYRPGQPAAPEAELDETTGEIPVVAWPPGEAPGPAGTDDGLAPDLPPLPKATVTARVAMGSVTESGDATAPPVWPPAQPAKTAKRRLPVLIAVAVVLPLAAGGSAWALARSNDGDGSTARPAPAKQQSQAAVVAPSAAGSKSAAAAAVPADEQCTDEMKKSTRWVCITKATLRDNTFTVWYDAEWNGTTPDIKKGFHLHIYGGDGDEPDESTMGSQVVKHSKYYFEDQQPSVRRTSDSDFEAVGDAEKVCARIAQTGHGLAKASDGSYHTGNCIPIQRY